MFRTLIAVAVCCCALVANSQEPFADTREFARKIAELRKSFSMQMIKLAPNEESEATFVGECAINQMEKATLLLRVRELVPNNSVDELHIKEHSTRDLERFSAYAKRLKAIAKKETNDTAKTSINEMVTILESIPAAYKPYLDKMK